MSTFDEMMQGLEDASDFAPAKKVEKPITTAARCSCNGMGCSRCNAKIRNPIASRWDRARKAAIALADKKDAFEEREPGLIEFMRANTWSEFFCSLLSSFETYGSLTDNQVRAARASQAKMVTAAEQRAKEKDAKRTAVDLATIKAMFDSAVASGLKRTKYRAEGLELTRAPDHGRNPGAIYVNRTSDSEYVGKVIGGKFEPVRSTSEEDKLALLRIAENPREAAIRWGQKTGTCSCCGRELTNAESIALGIGPICATKWGL